MRNEIDEAKQYNSLIKYAFHIINKYKIYFGSLLLIAILASLFHIFVNYNVAKIIDAIQENGHKNISFLLFLFVLYKFLHHGVFFVRRLVDIKYKPKMLSEILKDMYKKAANHSLYWFETHLSGEISHKVIEFLNANSLITNMFNAARNIATILISIIFLFKISKPSAILIVLFIGIYTPVIGYLLKKLMVLQEDYTRTRQNTFGTINDSIANIFNIKIIGNLLSELKLKFIPSILHLQSWDQKTRVFDAYPLDFVETILVVIMGGGQIYLLAYLYSIGQITAGSFAFIVMITFIVHDELESLLESVIFNLGPTIASLKTSFAFINTSTCTHDRQWERLIVTKGEIEFKNVSFKYCDDTSNINILDKFNLHIKPGEKIGIVGLSGAGKTTIIKCLLKYFPIDSGQILIDGQDIAQYNDESIWENFSIIPQDIMMFHRSVRENLLLAKYDATLDEITSACKRAKIHDEIMAMPLQYNSIIGERGLKLSAGQRQRLAIARAILKNAPILILDEATSALDNITEDLIHDSFKHLLFEGKMITTIVIAHRLSTLIFMDRIIVIDKGSIVQSGTHSQLIEIDGMYKNLWKVGMDKFIPE